MAIDCLGQTIREGDQVKAWDDGVELTAQVFIIEPGRGAVVGTDLLTIIRADTKAAETRDSDQVELIGTSDA